MRLRCPACGNEKRFVSDGWTETWKVYVDADGNWAGHADDCSYHDVFDDGATMACPECGHEGGWGEFEDAAERGAVDGR